MAKAKNVTAKNSTKKRLKKATSPSVTAERLLQDVWPLERDFFERPDRYRYVRQLIPMQGCVFCKAEEAPIGFKSLCLAKSKHSMVVMNKYPYNSAHLLVLPRRHIANVWDLHKEEMEDMALWIRASMTILDRVYKCAGINVGMNHGKVAGAGIPEHLHWHVIPRWAGDTNFFPLIAQTKALAETLKQSYERLRKDFKKEMNRW